MIQNAVKSPGSKWVARLHRYEIYSPRVIQNIKKSEFAIRDKIDKFVFVSDYIRRKAISMFPWMENSITIPNLYDHRLFPCYPLLPVKERKHKDILFLGRRTYVKNIPLALQFFKELCISDRGMEYNLFFVGSPGEPEVDDFIIWFVSKNNLSHRVHIFDQVQRNSLRQIMWNMDFIIATSYIESQGMGIIEGMSTGLRPLIYNFPGSDCHFRRDWIFNDVETFIRMIKEGNRTPEEYSRYAIDNFSIEKNIHRYDALLKTI